jgi:hypothetical protein
MEDVMFDGLLAYFTAILYISCTSGIFCGNLVHFSRIGMLYQEKSGNPAGTDVFFKYFHGQCLYFSFQHSIQIKSFYTQQHSYVSLKNLIPWRDSNPGLSFLRIWDRCYDFKNIFAENFGENVGVFCSSYC